MGKHVFCTDLCQERGEPMEGLGDAPQRVLMLAWPIEAIKLWQGG